MSMSTWVYGFTSPENKTYQKHKKVLLACLDAGVLELPKETAEYFGESSVGEYLLEDKLRVVLPVTKWEGVAAEGFELKVSDIPEGVSIIRFLNSW